jgi:hypothetical protein
MVLTRSILYQSTNINQIRTFARSTSAVLTVDVFSDAITSAVLRRRVVALATSKLETVGAARRPRGPRGPLPVDGRTDLVARLLLHVRAFAARTAVDGRGHVAGSGSLANASAALRVAFRPLAPRAPFTGNWKRRTKKNN